MSHSDIYALLYQQTGWECPNNPEHPLIFRGKYINDGECFCQVCEVLVVFRGKDYRDYHEVWYGRNDPKREFNSGDPNLCATGDSRALFDETRSRKRPS